MDTCAYDKGCQMCENYLLSTNYNVVQMSNLREFSLGRIIFLSKKKMVLKFRFKKKNRYKNYSKNLIRLHKIVSIIF